MGTSISLEGAYDPFGHMPLYSSDDGRQGHNPLALAGEHPQFSLSKLALYFSTPAVVGEFLPDCPWQGVTRLRASIAWPPQTTHIDDLVSVFQQSLAYSIGDAATVAVALSGGLDSLAVLYHASKLCLRDGRRLVAVTTDLPDDTGHRCIPVVQQVVRDLSLSCEFHHVTAEASIDATWHARGPRTDAMPRFNRAMADTAQAADADVLLTGSGADELLGSVRYLTPHLLRSRRWHDACSYLHDVVQGGGVRRLETELFAAMASLLPKRYANRLYWATNWPELCRVQAPSLLAERFRPSVERWTATWLQDTLLFHEAHHRPWAVKDAWDALFPLDILPQAGSIPEKDPFLHPFFMEYAMGLPLVERYSGALRTPYHRRKAPVLRLYPPHLHPVLPRAKQLFSHAFSDYQRHMDIPSRCIAYGLLDEEAFVKCCDPSLLGMAEMVEQWIAGTEKVGGAAVG